MKKSLIGSLVAAGCAAVFAVSAGAQTIQFAKPEDAIKYRQGAFQLIKTHFGTLQPVVRGQVPYDKDAVAADIYVLDVVARLPWAAFAEGTQGGGAKDNVWSDPEGFNKAKQNFLDSLKPLTAAADEGDLDKLRAAFAKTGASCKACHDSYRN
ncbi:c-type cytochrome [Orrella marina]|uniref:Cytochrome C n=1 Tax=Orrella marina TaxID=2163011 RepID=A0A2R4XFU4_9BURK|nr:cytochrome c [Orrella marina]AWB32676.1 cytochrome C [Orrella marina]